MSGVLSLAPILLGLQVGFSFVCLSGLQSQISTAFPNVDPTLHLEVLVSLLSTGALVGCPVGGMLCDFWGRKPALLTSAGIIAAGGICMGLALDFSWLLVGRLTVGIGVGIGLSANNLFVSELAPPSSRGRYIALFELSMSFGIGIAYVTPTILKTLHLSWNVALGVGQAGPAVLLLCLVSACLPESPHYLFAIGRELEADAALRKMRGDIEGAIELASLQAARGANETASGHGVDEAQPPLFKRGATGFLLNTGGGGRLLLVGVALIVCQQASGQPTAMSYAHALLSALALDLSQDLEGAEALGFAACKALGTWICYATVDTWGRRPLLLLGQLGQLLGLAVALVARLAMQGGLGGASPFLALSGMCAYVLSYGFGYGGVVWVIMSEMFPAHMRGRCMAVVVGCNWGLQMLFVGSFLTVLAKLGADGALAIWFGCGVLALGFCWLAVPETLATTPEALLERAGAARAWFAWGRASALAPTLREPLLDAGTTPAARAPRLLPAASGASFRGRGLGEGEEDADEDEGYFRQSRLSLSYGGKVDAVSIVSDGLGDDALKSPPWWRKAQSRE